MCHEKLCTKTFVSLFLLDNPVFEKSGVFQKCWKIIAWMLCCCPYKDQLLLGRSEMNFTFGTCVGKSLSPLKPLRSRASWNFGARTFQGFPPTLSTI